MENTTQATLVDIVKTLVPALTALAGIAIGAWLTHLNAKRQLRNSKSVEFAERRVREFYSPMIGNIQKIQAIAYVRNEISRASDVAWQKICAQQPKPFLDHKEYFKPFQASIDFDNATLRSEVLPAYDRMVDLFTQNFWLASPEIQKEYGELFRFVQLWHRFSQQSVPREVLMEIGHTEERLVRLYSLLNSELNELRAFIANE